MEEKMLLEARRNVLITFIITCFLVIIVTCFSYVIYCYAYYDKNETNEIIEYYNTFKFDKFYDSMKIKNDSQNLSRETFHRITNLMYNKLTLENIYNSYYKNKDYYQDKDDFISQYYYGYNDAKTKDFSFNFSGKTTLTSRRKTTVNGVKIRNEKGTKSYLGILQNITFLIENGASLKIDDNEITCTKNDCFTTYLFGGIHQIEYIKGGFTYYSITNISESNSVVDVTKLQNLIPINKKLSLNVDSFSETVDEQSELKLNNGIYELSECYLQDGCPAKKLTYMTINEDGTCTYHVYYSLTRVHDTYNGEYKFENGFLNVTFNNHIYEAYDYDTKATTNITTDVKIDMTFRINANESFSNANYVFIKKA